MQKAVASSGGIWAESNLKNSLSFSGKNKVRNKVASGTSFAHEGSGEPGLLWGLFPLVPTWALALCCGSPKESPLVLPV